MIQKALSKIKKIDEKLEKFHAEKNKIETEIDQLLLAFLKENDALKINLTVLLGALQTTVSKLKNNDFSENDLSELTQLGEKLLKKSTPQKKKTLEKNPQKQAA